jgi:hypothetical protein
MRKVEPDQSAFGSRRTPYLFSVDAIWDDPAQTESIIAWQPVGLRKRHFGVTRGEVGMRAGHLDRLLNENTCGIFADGRAIHVEKYSNNILYYVDIQHAIRS